MLSPRNRWRAVGGNGWDELGVPKGAWVALLVASMASPAMAWFPDVESRTYLSRTIWNPDPGDFEGEEHGMMRSPPIVLPDDWVLAGRTTPVVPRTWNHRLDQVEGKSAEQEALARARLGQFERALRVARDGNLPRFVIGSIYCYRIWQSDNPTQQKSDADEAIRLFAKPDSELPPLPYRMVSIKRDFLEWAFDGPAEARAAGYKPAVANDAEALLTVRAMAAVAYTELVRVPDWFDGMETLYVQLKAPYEASLARQMAQDLRLDKRPSFKSSGASPDIEMQALFLGFKSTARDAQKNETEWMEKQAAAGKLPESDKDYWKGYVAVPPPETSSVQLNHEDRRDYPPKWDKRAITKRTRFQPKFLTQREEQEQDMILTLVIGGTMVLAIVGVIYYYVTRGRYD